MLEKLLVASHQTAKAVTKGSQLKAALPGEHLPKMHVMHAVRDMLLRAVLSHTFAGRTNAGETLLVQK